MITLKILGYVWIVTTALALIYMVVSSIANDITEKSFWTGYDEGWWAGHQEGLDSSLELLELHVPSIKELP